MERTISVTMVKIPIKNEGVLSQQINNETLLYNPSKGNVHVLNTTAAFVWELCDGLHTIEDMINHLNENYQFPEGSNVIQDLTEIINKFSEMEIIS